MRVYKSNGYVVFVGILFLVLGSLGVLYAIKSFGTYNEQIAAYEQTYGTIIDVYEHRQKNGDTIEELTICKVRYVINDELYINENVIEKDSFKVGDNPIVYYKQTSPENGFVMDDDLKQYGIIGIIGIIALCSGIGIISIGMNAREVIVINPNREFNVNNEYFENEIWKNKIKEIRQKEINDNQRVFSRIQENTTNQNMNIEPEIIQEKEIDLHSNPYENNDMY